MSMAMKVAGKEEGEGGKAMAMATRLVGERMVTAIKRAMATKMREAGEEEGGGNGSKSNGDGKEDCDGKQQRQQP
jgi:hypothetical protein